MDEDPHPLQTAPGPSEDPTGWSPHHGQDKQTLLQELLRTRVGQEPGTIFLRLEGPFQRQGGVRQDLLPSQRLPLRSPLLPPDCHQFAEELGRWVLSIRQ